MSKVKWIAIIGTLIILGGVIVGFLLSQKPKDVPAAVEQKVVEEEPPPIEHPLYIDLGKMAVNLKDGQHTLRASIQLLLGSEPAAKWLEERLPLVKDLVLSQLQTLTTDQVTQSQSRLLLRQDLMIKVNSLVPNSPPWKDKNPVKQILLQEFYQD